MINLKGGKMKITEQLEEIAYKKAQERGMLSPESAHSFVIGYLLQIVESEIPKNPNLKAYVEWILENEK